MHILEQNAGNKNFKVNQFYKFSTFAYRTKVISLDNR